MDDRRLNYREFHISLFGSPTTRVSGMAHPSIVAGRELGNLLQFLREEKGITHLVSLESRFSDTLQVEWESRGGKRLLLPIEDFEAPTLEQVNRVLRYLDEEGFFPQHTDHEGEEENNHDEGNSQQHLTFHCRGGNGRTGTLLSALLQISWGQKDPSRLQVEDRPLVKVPLDPYGRYFTACPEVVAEAISLVRSTNNDWFMIETPEQVHFLVQLFHAQREGRLYVPQ